MNITLPTNWKRALQYLAAIGAAVLTVLPTSTTGEPTPVRIIEGVFACVIGYVEHNSAVSAPKGSGS